MALSHVLLYNRGEPTVYVWLVELMCRFLVNISGGCEWSVAGKEAGVYVANSSCGLAHAKSLGPSCQSWVRVFADQSVP